MNLTPIESSHIHSAGYDPETRIMRVRFRDYIHKGNGVVKPGAVIDHLDVAPEVYEAFMASDSRGKHYNDHIRQSSDRGFEHRRVGDDNA